MNIYFQFMAIGLPGLGGACVPPLVVRGRSNGYAHAQTLPLILMEV